MLCAGTGAAQHEGQLRAQSDGLVPRPVVVGGRQPSHPTLPDDAVKQSLYKVNIVALGNPRTLNDEKW